MATELKFRGGTTAQHATFTGADREVTVDTDKYTLIVHDGSTAGGHETALTATTVEKTTSTGSAVLPVGTDAQRDGTPSAGYLRWNTDQGSAEVYDGSAWGSVGGAGGVTQGLFRKADPTAVAWTKTGNGTAESQTAIYVEVNGSSLTIASGTSVDMPSLVAGTDYAIWAETDGSLQASSNHTTPPSADARKVGGFHYAAGSNASAQSGGDTTAQINEYSFWDLKFRPTCDPRGMTLVAGGFWADIYLTGVDHHTNGTSKYNVTIADGSSPPKVPSNFGGNGSTTYGSYTWFETQELLASHGKRTPTQQEFMALAYGTTEASAIGSDPSTTNWDNAYVSKWGVNQSSGCMWVWGLERGGPYAGASWNANTDGRGSEYNAPNAALFGGNWDRGSLAGSRCSLWHIAASLSDGSLGSRGVCDHMILD